MRFVVDHRGTLGMSQCLTETRRPGGVPDKGTHEPASRRVNTCANYMSYRSLGQLQSTT